MKAQIEVEIRGPGQYTPASQSRPSGNPGGFPGGSGRFALPGGDNGRGGDKGTG